MQIDVPLLRQSKLQHPRYALAVLLVSWCGPGNATTWAHHSTMDQIDRIQRALVDYRVEHGMYPSTQQGLIVLAQDKQDGEPGDVRLSAIVDRWGTPLAYRDPSRHGPQRFDLWSFGRNEVDHGGAGDDLSNWAGYDGGIYQVPRPWGLWAAMLLLFALFFALPAWLALRRKRPTS